MCAGACVLGESVRQVRQARVSRLPGAVCAATLAGAAGARTVGLVRHGTCLRRVQGCGIGESVNLDNLGLEVTVHESRVTSVQKRMEPRRSLLGASVDVTDGATLSLSSRRDGWTYSPRPSQTVSEQEATSS